MTPLTDTADWTSSTQAPPTGKPKRPAAHVLADPRVRLGGRGGGAGGTSAWALSKVVKRLVRRPRSAGLLPGTRRRGREPAGLGYLSGHADVAVALGAGAFPRLGPGSRVGWDSCCDLRRRELLTAAQAC